MTWAQMEFGHEVHQRTNLMLINASEELIETLEDNQVYYMSYLNSPIMSFLCYMFTYYEYMFYIGPTSKPVSYTHLTLPTIYSV